MDDAGIDAYSLARYNYITQRQRERQSPRANNLELYSLCHGETQHDVQHSPMGDKSADNK